MLKDNQLSTVLLLVALGFLIYYLVKPCATEGFAQEEKPTESTQVVLPPSDSQPASVPVVQPDVVNQVMAESLAAPSVIINDVFNFEGNDTLQSGAELSTAFERPIPQDARPDQVDLNKNNVKKYDAKDFLPKEVNDKWFDTDFSQAKYNVNDDKLINTDRYVIGVNTVGQSLKNASYDIRGTIPNPKFSVSPWNNSTYEADYNLKPLC